MTSCKEFFIIFVSSSSLLLHGALSKPQTNKRNRSFLRACNSGDTKKAKKLCTSQNINKLDDTWCMTPLHFAAKRGDLNIAKFLIQRNADIEAKTNYKWTPLHLACQEGHIEMVKLLIQYKAQINAKTLGCISPLHLAVIENHIEVVKFLLQNNASINDTFPSYNYNALHCAAELGHIKIIKLLLQHKAQINAKTTTHFTPLRLAGLSGKWEVVKYLLLNVNYINMKEDISYLKQYLIEKLIKKEDSDCPICLDALDKDNVAFASYNCLHLFHKKCKQKWWKSGTTNSKNCPLCRVPMYKEK